jgi:phosphatidylserine/phosphatidylglycerophosphate/cardiolipin synthase-like enzyme
MSTAGNLKVRAYPGDRNVLLAFDLDLPEEQLSNLAGFAIERTLPGETKAEPLLNRLSLHDPQTAATTPDQRPWRPSTEAPFQKFRWVDFPHEIKKGPYTYVVTQMDFAGNGLRPALKASLEVELIPTKPAHPKFEMGFTRGYISSQAYVDTFHNAPIRPTPKSLAYSTAKFERQYEWLGSHAREMVFAFLQEAVQNERCSIDLFAYDLDEPDIMHGLVSLRHRLRAFLDNSQLHTKAGALEIEARGELEASAGASNVRVGHFKRFAHSKVMILKENGEPKKVLTGSANFSVRGLYVQANNVLVFDDPSVAKLYADVFEECFTAPPKFVASPLADGWKNIGGPGLPDAQVAFSPHKTAAVSLNKVAQSIQGAKSSVLFAIMELGGSGPVMDAIQALGAGQSVFTYGVTQSMNGVQLHRAGQSKALFTPFAYLKEQVPAPFKEEWSGGAGQVIHHKFVVVDFNTKTPTVFTGSSNLASGGEESNGDNLLAISDPQVASAYAVEALRLVDHYHFRASLKGATDAKPLMLQGVGSKWWADYYKKGHIKEVERKLFV